MTVKTATDEAVALERDAADPLAAYRERFHLPVDAEGKSLLYFCGHSLGLQPRSVRDFVEEELNLWERRGVHGHFEGRRPWYSYHEALAGHMADLVGAKPLEVVMMNSLTVDLHLLMVSFYRPTIDRFKILVEADAFPSDRFAVASQVRFHGYDPERSLIRLQPREGEDLLRTEDILEIIAKQGSRISLILLGGVNYVTGQVLDMEAIARQGRKYGCIVGFDLAHAAGNVSLDLHVWDVDFAVWCSYKYLNGGPGGVGGAFVHERHAAQSDLPRFAGWWGHDPDTRFALAPRFAAQPGAPGWQLSNAPILSMAAARASLEIFAEAGRLEVLAKSAALTDFLLDLLNDVQGVKVVTPREAHGCQVSFRVPEAKAVFEALEAAGVAADFREPGTIRVAPVPLYNTFHEVWRFVSILTAILQKGG